jgi:hypothetical protein
MEKINFVNGSTPAINDTNMNKLQDNVEDAIDEVQDDVDTKLDASSVKTTQTTSDTDTYSCTYINGIVESGNNTNGEWIKFVDGTMICYYDSGTDSITVVSNDITDAEIVFPQQFISSPLVSTIMNSDSTSATMGYIQHSAKSVTTSGFTFRWFSKDSTYRAPYYGYIAIGKWK